MLNPFFCVDNIFIHGKVCVTILGLDLIDWALNVTGTPNAPKVHSISWGSGESGFDTSTVNRWEISRKFRDIVGPTLSL